jgi:hypothetical protein
LVDVCPLTLGIETTGGVFTHSAYYRHSHAQVADVSFRALTT